MALNDDFRKNVRDYEGPDLKDRVKKYTDEIHRSWIFRTVGYGHPRHFWCDFISTLRMTGYDGVLSMEHEDSLMTPREGLEKGVRFLQSIVLEEAKGKVTWA